MKTAEFLTEAYLIRAGKHSAYRAFSDRINNFETFCASFARDFPAEALEIAQDIENNIGAASEVSGMTEYGCGIAASILKSTAVLYL